jgi:hypothetical protein
MEWLGKRAAPMKPRSGQCRTGALNPNLAHAPV